MDPMERWEVEAIQKGIGHVLRRSMVEDLREYLGTLRRANIVRMRHRVLQVESSADGQFHNPDDDYHLHKAFIAPPKVRPRDSIFDSYDFVDYVLAILPVTSIRNTLVDFYFEYGQW